LLLYYITDRSQFGGDEASRRKKLLDKIAEAADCGVDFIQLREKDLSTHELELLARDAVRVVRENSPRLGTSGHVATRLLVNSRTDVAIACGADGVHLRSDDISPDIVREIWRRSLIPGRANPFVSVACHTVPEVTVAAEKGSNIPLFGPIFGKREGRTPVPPVGLSLLKDACQQKISITALGGITLENARTCLGAGAAGIAGIRIFQENEISQVVRHLRSYRIPRSFPIL
jgi:thiamine-phosphate pyrophosphorylase